jgi:hypothetical protein
LGVSLRASVGNWPGLPWIEAFSSDAIANQLIEVLLSAGTPHALS